MPTLNNPSESVRSPYPIDGLSEHTPSTRATKVIVIDVDAAATGNSTNDHIEELQSRLGHASATAYAVRTNYTVGQLVYWRDTGDNNKLKFYRRLTAGQDPNNSTPAGLPAVWRQEATSVQDVPVDGDISASPALLVKEQGHGGVRAVVAEFERLQNAQTEQQVITTIEAYFTRATRQSLWRGEWQPRQNYAVGQYVWDQDGNLYRRLTVGQDSGGAERPSNNAGDWFRIVGVEVYMVQSLRRVYESAEYLIELSKGPSNRGMGLARRRDSEHWEYQRPKVNFRGAWGSTTHYYYNDMVTHLNKVWVLIDSVHITATASGNGTIPGTFASWVEVGVLDRFVADWAQDGNEDTIPSDKLSAGSLAGVSLKASETIDYDSDVYEHKLKSPGEGAVWADTYNDGVDTGAVQSREVRDLTVYDISEGDEQHLTAAGLTLDNVTLGGRLYSYWRNPQGVQRGSGWRLDNGQTRGWNNQPSSDILINVANTKLRGVYEATVGFADLHNQPDNPDRVIVNLIRVSDGHSLASVDAYDIAQHSGDVPLRQPTPDDTGGNIPLGTVSGDFTGLLSAVTGHASWIQLPENTVYVQADLSCETTGSIGPVQVTVFQPNQGSHLPEVERRQDIDTHLNNGNFYWSNVISVTNGSYTRLGVRLDTRGGAVHLDRIRNLKLIMRLHVHEPESAKVTLNFPELSYGNNTRLWLGVQTDSGKPQRSITFSSQKMTLWNADDIAGRDIDATGASSAHYRHVSFTISDTQWWRDGGDGILEAVRDAKQASIIVAIPRLTDRSGVSLYRYRDVGVSKERVAFEASSRTEIKNMAATIRGVKAGDKFEVTLDHPISAGAWGLQAFAQSPDGLPSTQVRTPGLLKSSLLTDFARRSNVDVWVRLTTPAAFSWAEDRQLTFLSNLSHNEWKADHLHTRAFREIGGTLALGRLNNVRASTDHYICIRDPVPSQAGLYVAPLADGGIAYCGPGPASSTHQVRVIME